MSPERFAELAVPFLGALTGALSGVPRLRKRLARVMAVVTRLEVVNATQSEELASVVRKVSRLELRLGIHGTNPGVRNPLLGPKPRGPNPFTDDEGTK